MAAAEDKALAQPPSSLSSTVMQHLRNTKLLPGSSPVLRSDSDLQHSKPPITVTPFWGPGLSSAASQTSPAASSSTYASLEGDHSDQDPPRPRSYSRDGNLSTSRDNSREGSMHGGNNLWQFNFSITREVLRSMFYKRLCWRLGAQPAQESLIAKALQASSTGHTPPYHTSMTVMQQCAVIMHSM